MFSGHSWMLEKTGVSDIFLFFRTYWKSSVFLLVENLKTSKGLFYYCVWLTTLQNVKVVIRNDAKVTL